MRTSHERSAPAAGGCAAAPPSPHPRQQIFLQRLSTRRGWHAAYLEGGVRQRAEEMLQRRRAGAQHVAERSRSVGRADQAVRTSVATSCCRRPAAGGCCCRGGCPGRHPQPLARSSQRRGRLARHVLAPGDQARSQRRGFWGGVADSPRPGLPNTTKRIPSLASAAEHFIWLHLAVRRLPTAEHRLVCARADQVGPCGRLAPAVRPCI